MPWRSSAIVAYEGTLTEVLLHQMRISRQSVYIRFAASGGSSWKPCSTISLGELPTKSER